MQYQEKMNGWGHPVTKRYNLRCLKFDFIAVLQKSKEISRFFAKFRDISRKFQYVLLMLSKKIIRIQKMAMKKVQYLCCFLSGDTEKNLVKQLSLNKPRNYKISFRVLLELSQR
jgi:hypothetical protein